MIILIKKDRRIGSSSMLSFTHFISWSLAICGVLASVPTFEDNVNELATVTYATHQVHAFNDVQRTLRNLQGTTSSGATTPNAKTAPVTAIPASSKGSFTEVRPRSRGRHNHKKSSPSKSKTTGLYLLPVSGEIVEIPDPWRNITMPKKSYFGGYSAPTNALKWNQAQLQASRGNEFLSANHRVVVIARFSLYRTSAWTSLFLLYTYVFFFVDC
jgi:hypothetical protein